MPTGEDVRVRGQKRRMREEMTLTLTQGNWCTLVIGTLTLPNPYPSLSLTLTQATLGNQLKLSSDELNCRSKRRYLVQRTALCQGPRGGSLAARWSPASLGTVR